MTTYDRQHFVTYLRLLDAKADGADWTEVARIVLDRDPDKDGQRSRKCWRSHFDRAEWFTREGYRLLLEQAAGDGIAPR
ncbi:MAG: DNA -binding domain-containing protein [Jhaorihella sp.]